MKKWFRSFLERIWPDSHPVNQKAVTTHKKRQVRISIDRYRDLSQELKDTIEQNHFARYLRYEGLERSDDAHDQ